MRNTACLDIESDNCTFQTKDDSEWMEENIYTRDSSGYDWINASQALSDLDSWLNDNDYLLPNYDQATSFTRY